MKAVLLAAGVGDRLRPFTDHHPKCLVEVGGTTLLVRHLDILSSIPTLNELVIVVGYLDDQIRDAVAAWTRTHAAPMRVTFDVNPEFRKGSILSLYTAKDHLVEDDCVIMDADVLYPKVLMDRLVHSAHANCFLLDGASVRTGEEMMVCVKNGRALHIARSREESTADAHWDKTGEGVGFFKLDRHDSKALVQTMATLIAEGFERAEYEVALDRFMKDHEAGYEDVGDLPWTEIDFIEDVQKAENDVLPHLEAQGLA